MINLLLLYDWRILEYIGKNKRLTNMEVWLEIGKKIIRWKREAKIIKEVR